MNDEPFMWPTTFVHLCRHPHTEGLGIAFSRSLSLDVGASCATQELIAWSNSPTVPAQSSAPHAKMERHQARARRSARCVNVITRVFETLTLTFTMQLTFDHFTLQLMFASV